MKYQPNIVNTVASKNIIKLTLRSDLRLLVRKQLHRKEAINRTETEIYDLLHSEVEDIRTEAPPDELKYLNQN